MSTTTSQLLDTVVFVSGAFWMAPTLVGVGISLPIGALLATIAGQYPLKLPTAAVDTPVIYAAVWAIEKRIQRR